MFRFLPKGCGILQSIPLGSRLLAHHCVISQPTPLGVQRPLTAQHLALI